jgi:hypothetical protein
MSKEIKGIISIPSYIEFRELDGEGVILNLDNEQYYGLDSIATRMWVLLSTFPRIIDVYNFLQNDYQVDPEILRNDLVEFVLQLSNQGLIEISYEED